MATPVVKPPRGVASYSVPQSKYLAFGPVEFGEERSTELLAAGDYAGEIRHHLPALAEC